MSEPESHGTGWVETETLLDVVEIYNSWDGVSTPDFTVAQKRLHRAFSDDELHSLDTVLETLRKLIDHELTWRTQDSANVDNDTSKKD